MKVSRWLLSVLAILLTVMLFVMGCVQEEEDNGKGIVGFWENDAGSLLTFSSDGNMKSCTNESYPYEYKDGEIIFGDGFFLGGRLNYDGTSITTSRDVVYTKLTLENSTNPPNDFIGTWAFDNSPNESITFNDYGTGSCNFFRGFGYYPTNPINYEYHQNGVIIVNVNSYHPSYCSNFVFRFDGTTLWQGKEYYKLTKVD